MLIFRNLQVYSSLDELKIITFWKIIQNGNIFLLDKNHSEKRMYKDKELNYLLEVWNKLYDDYYKLQDDPKQRAKMTKSKESITLKFKVKTLINLLNSYEVFFRYGSLLNTKEYVEKENEIFELFKELGFTQKISPFSTTKERLDLVTRYTKAVVGKYNRLQKEVESGTQKQIDNMYIQVVSIERVIERPIPNIENITVMQWIAYEKQANDIIQAQKKLSNGKK